MKMYDEHLQELRGLLDEIREKMGDNWSIAIKRGFENGLTAKRLRWNFIWMIERSKRQIWFDKVYKYLNDEHIDTALKHITDIK